MSKLPPQTADDYLVSKKRIISSSNKPKFTKNTYFSINDSKSQTNNEKIIFYQDKINGSLYFLGMIKNIFLINNENTDYYLTQITYYLSKLYSIDQFKIQKNYVKDVLDIICKKGLYKLFKKEFTQIGDNERYDYDNLKPESCRKTNTLSEVTLSSSSNSGNNNINTGLSMTNIGSSISNSKINSEIPMTEMISTKNANIRPNTSSQSSNVLPIFNNQIKDDIMRFSNVPGIEFRFDNEKQLIILCIDNDINKNIDVLHIFDIKTMNGSNKRIYDWKNNFSLEFLNKIFSFQPDVAYSLLHFYFLLLEYNKDSKNKYNELVLHEYIYFIMNSKIINSNFFNNIKNIKNQNKIESIFRSIINKNIFSTDFLKKNKSVFYDFCYSYDYFIKIWLIDVDTLNNNKSKIDIKKLKDKVTFDLNRNRERYFIDGINYEKKYTEVSKGKYDYSIFFEKIKELVNKFMEDNKDIGETFNDIYIKILQSLYQNLRAFSVTFFTFFLRLYHNDTIYYYNPTFLSVNVGYINKNIIIDIKEVLQFKYNNDSIPTIFLKKNADIKIDILNNKICFKHSFEWVDENIRKMILRNFKLKKMNNKRLAIINFDEQNAEYNENSCSKYLSDIQTNFPLFVLVSTQNSTTKFKKGDSVSFQHIMKEKLEEIGYSYRIKGQNIKDYDYGLKKISGKPVDRLRLYLSNDFIKNNNINNVGIDILQKKMLSNGTLCIKLKFKDNGVQKKYIFLNTNLPQQNNNKTFEYIFDLLTTDNSFFQGNNRKTQNLIDLFHEGYDIYFLGNIDLTFLNNKISKLREKKNSSNSHKFHDDLFDKYFIKIGNSIMNKNKSTNLKKPSIMNSREKKKEYSNRKIKIQNNYLLKTIDFFINTTIFNGNNIFYTSLNKNDNSNIVNII
jgi:hypothetical protein